MFGAHSCLLQVSATLPQRRQTCDAVPAPRRVASAAAAVEVNRQASESFEVDPMKVGRGEKVDFLQQSTLHSRPMWKKRRVFVVGDKILYTDESLLKVKRPLLQLTGQSKVGVPDDLRETTFAPEAFMLQIEGEMDRQPFIVLLALSDESSFEAWKSLLLQVIRDIDDKSGFQTVRAAGTFFCGTDSACFRLNSHLIGREMTPVRG